MAVSERVHRRDELVKVAARLFRERGYNGTSMQDLAGELGILRGSLYAHIASKEDLLFDIIDRGADRFLTRIEEVVAAQVPPDEKLRLAIRGHIETVAEHIDASTVFLNDWKFLSSDRRDAIQGKRDLYESMIREIVEEGVEWEIFPEDTDPKFATLLILSAVNWVHQWYSPEGPSTPGEIADRFSDMILHGLTTGRRGQ